MDGIVRIDCARVYGMDYVRFTEADGGELYVNRFGWPLLEHVRPAAWYNDQQYATRGARLPGGTGNVYCVPTSGRGGRQIDLVVKFSRFAQEVPIVVVSTLPPGLREEDITNARFNGPFEEFGLLRDLRKGLYGPQDLHILTKRPLAIYSPPDPHSLYTLGRSAGRVYSYIRSQDRDQTSGPHETIHLHGDRQYVTIFGYAKGINAEEAFNQGMLTEQQLERLTDRVTAELHLKGFRVLDNKPKHYILRRRNGTGDLLRRDGRLVYLLVDFELLERTPEYTAYLQANMEQIVAKTVPH